MSYPVPRKGILAALWLPTDAAGNLLRSELARNLAFLKIQGIYGVLALGSTGEFPRFDLEQRKRALAVIANVSDIQLRDVPYRQVTSSEIGTALRLPREGRNPSTTPW